jgi:hypothetical protein
MGHEAPAFAFREVDAVVRSALPPGGTAHANLGLADLPSRLGRLAEGMIYGLACDQQAVRLPILAGALAASLQSGKQCALFTPSDPKILLRKARLAGFALEPWLKEDRLAVFQTPGEAASHLFRAGVERFLAQLEKSFPQREAFLVFDQADSLFLLSDPRAGAEAAQRYVDWIGSRRHTLLALFTPAAHAAREFLTLRLVAENFGGFALARPSDGGPLLEIRHWFGAEGASPRESFVLRSAGNGALGARATAALRCPDQVAPVEHVICPQDAAAIADALDAARCSEAATLVLPFERPGDHPVLCRAVGAVRALARPSLRVVVREYGIRLRASQALALLRLGASSIVPAGLPDSAAKRLVDTLQGTRFTRPYDTDIDEVEAETTNLLGGEVRSAAAFRDAVERLLAAADGFEIESCLVRLDIDHGRPSKALVLARRLGREFAALIQGSSLWLFLFGCPARVAPAVFKRMFIAPPADFCSSVSMQQEANRILLELRSLRDS